MAEVLIKGPLVVDQWQEGEAVVADTLEAQNNSGLGAIPSRDGA